MVFFLTLLRPQLLLLLFGLLNGRSCLLLYLLLEIVLLAHVCQDALQLFLLELITLALLLVDGHILLVFIVVVDFAVARG